MDQVTQRERDLLDLRAAHAATDALAARVRLLENVERVAIAALATLDAVAPEAAADLRARLTCATD